MKMIKCEPTKSSVPNNTLVLRSSYSTHRLVTNNGGGYK